MRMKYQFSSEQYADIKAARKANQDKRTDRRLEALELRSEGKRLKDISSGRPALRYHLLTDCRKHSLHHGSLLDNFLF